MFSDAQRWEILSVSRKSSKLKEDPTGHEREIILEIHPSAGITTSHATFHLLAGLVERQLQRAFSSSDHEVRGTTGHFVYKLINEDFWGECFNLQNFMFLEPFLT